MPGVEEVLSDKILAVKRIAQWVYQWNQARRCIERHQGDGNKSATQKNTKCTKEKYGQARIAKPFNKHPQAGAPEDGENGR